MSVVEAVRKYFARRPLPVRVIEVLAPLTVVAAYSPEVALVFGREALIGWGLGSFGLVIAGIAQAYRCRRSAEAGTTGPADGESRSQSSYAAIRILPAVIFLAAVAFLRTTDVAGADFDRSGLFVIVYSISRFILFLSLLLAFQTLGFVMLERLAPGFKKVDATAGTVFVLCFFLGAAVYGLVFVLFGWFGLIGLPAALIVTVPVLMLTPRPMVDLCVVACHRAWGACDALRGPERWVRLLLVWCVSVSGILLVLSRGLYPGQTTNDVWEHYLHYYRDVLSSGNLGPHSTWYHFHQSKGAGLFFLAGSLSDELAPQLISLCFIATAAVIVFLMLRRFTGDSSWALLGVIILFTTYRGGFFKHHDVLTGFLAFIVWSTLEVGTRTEVARRSIATVLTVVAFYVGLYLPMGSAIIAVFWFALLPVLALVPGWRVPARIIAPASVALLAGVAVTMSLNYAVTGLAEVVPIAYFWSFADVEKFERVFGMASIAYFLDAPGSHLDAAKTPIVRWLLQAFRYHHLHAFFPPTMAVLTSWTAFVFLCRRRSFAPTRAAVFSLAVLSTFCASALLFSLLIRNVSLARMYAFSALLLTVLFVLLNRAVLRSLCARAILPWATSALLSLLGVFALGQSLWYSEYGWRVSRTALASFFTGEHSLGQVMAENERLFKQHVKLDVVRAMRRQIGDSPAIINLGTDPGPANAFPGAGLTGGVSHAFGPEYLNAVFGSPPEARAILQRLELDYFLYDLRNDLTSALAYSPLFLPGNLERNFRVIYHSGASYLLTWRNSGESDPVPLRFRQVLELAQTDAMRHARSEAFARDVDDILLEEVGIGSPVVMEHVGRRVAAAMTAGFSPVTVPSNRAFLSEMTTRVRQDLIAFLPELDNLARQSMVPEGVPMAGQLEAYRDEFGRLLQRSVARLLTFHCAERFGPAIADALTMGDRSALARVFSSREYLETIVRQER